MQQADIQHFLKRFFISNQCEIVEEGTGYFTVQLTIEMDKELMNRPFYWHYVEKTGGTPNPMKLTFITDPKASPSELSGEKIHFGSPRLHQIFQATKKFGGFIRLYEKTKHQSGNTALHPWIGVNVTISYVCDKKKDFVRSIGLHLINGTIVEEFQEKLESLSLTPKIPDYCFTITPIIKPQSGLKRIERYIEHIVEQDDHTWAEDAKQRMNRDMMLLNHFYEDLKEKPDVYWSEREALNCLYKPRIHINIENGGLFYLSANHVWTE